MQDDIRKPETEPTYVPAPHPFAKQKEDKVDFWRFSAELIKTALIVSVLAYLIRLFVFQPFIVDGHSMFPKFRTNDYLLVDKVSYRFHQPERGDIIVFKYPNDTSINYVKRVIGLPGETVKIEDGKVIVINKDHQDGIILEETYINPGSKTLSSQTEFVVPTNQYFVMGDNRPASSDSREWKYLPKEDIIGRVVLQAFPLDRFSLVTHARYNGE